MTNRKKKVIQTGVTREAADEAFASYAKSDAQIQKITAEIDLSIAKVREKWSEKLTSLVAERDAAFDVLQGYALEHKDELFTRKKSLEMAHGVIGFRTGTPKLKTLKGFTWASALQLVKRFLPGGYIRQAEELAKDKLLSDRDLEDVPLCDAPDGPGRRVPMREALSCCGIQVVQDETFYVEPKKEELS